MKKIKDFKLFRTVLIIVAMLIALMSLLMSHLLVRDLSREEKSKMEIFAEAYRTLNAADANTDLSLVLAVLSGNNTIPVIVMDDMGDVKNYLNIEVHREDTLRFLHQCAEKMRNNGNSIRLYYSEDSTDSYIEVCYDESLLLNRLTVYPYIQLCVVAIFVIIAIIALLSFKKTEQNRVWVGLSKETAHQLGTPISSLMAWVELIKDKYHDDMIGEMEKDVNRLEMIAERFSKIGSMPELKNEDMVVLLDSALTYIEHRTPASVKFIREFSGTQVCAKVNSSLFEWVVENLCKNAVDAMDGQGELTIELEDNIKMVSVEIIDTGKGIAKKSFRAVFEPGFTTKKRGWGLGLSLAKRIVEEYHKGRIFVKQSEIGKGTTFRIELNK